MMLEFTTNGNVSDSKSLPAEGVEVAILVDVVVSVTETVVEQELSARLAAIAKLLDASVQKRCIFHAHFIFIRR